MKPLLRALPLILAASALPSAARAQTTGTLRGTVTDPSGLVMVNAKMTATMQETKVSRVTSTDGSGDYEFPVFPVGHYTLEVEATGFKKYVQRDIELTLGHGVVVDPRLELGGGH